MTTKRLCISADSHVVESAEFFKPLQRRFGDQAPRVVVADPNRGPQLDLGNGQLGLGISGFFMANVDFTTPEALELRKKGYELARPGVYDPRPRPPPPACTPTAGTTGSGMPRRPCTCHSPCTSSPVPRRTTGCPS